jgi:hypothetical protein
VDELPGCNLCPRFCLWNSWVDVGSMALICVISRIKVGGVVDVVGCDSLLPEAIRVYMGVGFP